MKTGYISLHNNIFETLLALSASEQEHGLMFQEWPPPIMSFVYTKPQINKFWMKNTISPLDIIFCHNNEISQICYGEPFSLSPIGQNIPSDLIVEMPFGTAKQSNIKIGQKVSLISPNIKEIRKIISSRIL